MTLENQNPTGIQLIDADIMRRENSQERILQAMITYIERVDPNFLNNLMDRLSNPAMKSDGEYNHRGSEDYAEDFLHAVKRLGNSVVPYYPPLQRVVSHSRSAPAASEVDFNVSFSRQDNRICVSKENGLWQVRVDGEFFGDFEQRDDAMAAVDMLSPCIR